MGDLLWLCSVLFVLWFLGVLLSRHIQGLILLVSGSPRIATVVYDVLVLPGVVLHELSHAAVALTLGIRVLRINLFQFRSANDVRQGEVVVAKADPLRMSIVGAAPLIGGLIALLLLVRWLDPPPIALDIGMFDQLRQQLGTPLATLGLYLYLRLQTRCSRVLPIVRRGGWLAQCCWSGRSCCWCSAFVRQFHHAGLTYLLPKHAS
jgi:Zn-dependent protease